MLRNIEYSIRKLFKDHSIEVSVSQPEESEFISVISLNTYDKDKEAMDNHLPVETFSFVLHIVTENHSQMLDKFEKYLFFRESGVSPFTVYDFSTGTAVKDVECTISMPNRVQFNMPYGTTFMDDIIITYRQL